MDDLVERLRLLEQDHEPDGWPAVRMRDITALLDALEAAREDAERMDWLASEARMLSGWRETGRWEMPAIQIASARDRCLPDDLRAAIDADRKEARNG